MPLRNSPDPVRALCDKIYAALDRRVSYSYQGYEDFDDWIWQTAVVDGTSGKATLDGSTVQVLLHSTENGEGSSPTGWHGVSIVPVQTGTYTVKAAFDLYVGSTATIRMVRQSDLVELVSLSAQAINTWITLGSFALTAGQQYFIEVNDTSGRHRHTFGSLDGHIFNWYKSYSSRTDGNPAAATETSDVYGVELTLTVDSTSGAVISPFITPADLIEWDIINYLVDLHANNTVTVKIFDPAWNVIKDNVQNGGDISDIDPVVYPSVAVGVYLTRTGLGDSSPELQYLAIRCLK